MQPKEMSPREVWAGVRQTGSLLGVSLAFHTVPNGEGTPGCLQRLLLGSRPVEDRVEGALDWTQSHSLQALGRPPSQIISAAAGPPVVLQLPMEGLASPQAGCA